LGLQTGISVETSRTPSSGIIKTEGGMEMQNRSLPLVSLTFLYLIILPGMVLGAEFSANVHMHHQGQAQKPSKVYVKGEKRRQETSLEGQGKQIMIIRPDKKVVWILMPEDRMYMETSYQETEEEMASMQWTQAKQSRAKYLGEEKVSGYTCRKYEVSHQEDKSYVWVSETLESVLKMESEDGTMQYKNIEQKHMADSLFEIPSGYQKMGYPMMSPKASKPAEKKEQRKKSKEPEDDDSMEAAKKAGKSLLKSLGW
jgi:hypothetical protein